MLCSTHPISFIRMPKRVNTLIVYCTGGLASWSHEERVSGRDIIKGKSRVGPARMQLLEGWG